MRRPRPSSRSRIRPSLRSTAADRSDKLDKRIGIAMRQLGSKLAGLPEAYRGQVQKQIRQQVLDNLIMERVARRTGQAANIQIKPTPTSWPAR